jgi:hypothetical protein
MPPTSTRIRWTRPSRASTRCRACASTPPTTAGRRRSDFAEYYTAAYGNAIFDSSLRDNVTFADHSLATDSVFSETQLVSCRNVLIYFNKDLQDRALGLFHESLCHRGFLVLGSKESVDFSAYSDVSSRWSSPNGSTVMNGVRAVVIGASAGGVTALFTVLGALPAGFAIPVLCVLHLPDDRHSQLAEVLQRRLHGRCARHATRPCARADLRGRAGLPLVGGARRTVAEPGSRGIFRGRPSTTCSCPRPMPTATACWRAADRCQ